jgi:predicted transcriptional regulator
MMHDILRGRGSQFEAVFGSLELHVLDTLWARACASCVRDIQPAFPGVAYTTLMTTLHRLFRKGVLTRHKSGRAFYYTPMCSRDELRSRLATSVLHTLLPGESAAARPVLSLFVDVVGARDRALLDELEALVHERQRALDEKDGQ